METSTFLEFGILLATWLNLGFRIILTWYVVGVCFRLVRATRKDANNNLELHTALAVLAALLMIALTLEAKL